MLSYNISLQPKHNANLANTFLSAKDKIANSQQQKEKNTFYSKKIINIVLFMKNILYLPAEECPQPYSMWHVASLHNTNY